MRGARRRLLGFGSARERSWMARRDEETFWVLAARREEGSGCVLSIASWVVRIALTVYKAVCLVFLLHATTCSPGQVVASVGWERWEPHGGGTAWRSAWSL